MIHFLEVTCYRGNRLIFDQASCHIPAGTFNCLIGGIGGGKSTFLYLVSNHILANEGMILFCQRKLKKLQGNQLALHRRQIGLIEQEHRFLMQCNVEQNIGLPAKISGKAESDILFRTQEVAEELNLTYHLKTPIRNLSVGERQLVQIARVLVHQPMVILADDPTQFLDPTTSQEVLSLLYELPLKFGITVLVTTNGIEHWHQSTRYLRIQNHQIEEWSRADPVGSRS